MRILIVCMHYRPEPFVISDIAEYLSSKGHYVQVVTSKPHYGYDKIPEEYIHVDDEVINGVRVHRCDLAPRGDSTASIIKNYLTFYRNANSYLRKMKEDFDVVYSMSLSPIISVSGANIYAKKHHVKHVLHCLDLWPESVLITGAMSKANPLYGLLYLWSKSIYSKADEILVSSPSFISYFRDVLKMGKANIKYLMQPPLLSAQIGEDVKYSRPTFVYAGNIGRLQMIDVVVKAFKRVLDGGIDAGLVLIGNGSEIGRIRQLIAGLSLEGRVELLGMKPRGVTKAYYRNATAILVPLKRGGYVGDTIPSKLVSCLDEGRPILAVLGGDGEKLLRASGGAIFSSTESESDIALAMEKMLSLSEQEREKLGENNLHYYQQNCRQDQICSQIEYELIEAAKR